MKEGLPELIAVIALGKSEEHQDKWHKDGDWWVNRKRVIKTKALGFTYVDRERSDYEALEQYERDVNKETKLKGKQ